jgi:hypothetical protein
MMHGTTNIKFALEVGSIFIGQTGR